MLTPHLVAKVSMAHDQDINGVAFCPSEPNKLGTVSDDGTLKIWELRPARTGDVHMNNSE